MAVIRYHPEMGQKRPEAAQIDASLSHYGKHYFLDTPLELSGRGVTFLGKVEPYPPQVKRPNPKEGWNQYQVTIRAYEKICQEYTVSYEVLLD